MPELDLSSAQAINVAGRDVLAVRIANVNIWETPNPTIDYTVFGSSTPQDSIFEPFATGHDLGVGGWTANTFYTYGTPYVNGRIIGLRFWVPAGSALVGESITIGLFQTPAENGVSWLNYEPADIMEGLTTGEAVKSFPAGTLVQGWNELRFDSEWPLIHYAYFALGVSIGDGSHYQFAEATSSGPVRSSAMARLALSEDHGEFQRALFRVGTDSVNDSYWSDGHYGIDAIIRVPLTEQLTQHSIWSSDPPGDSYASYGGLGVGNWTTSHFYNLPDGGLQDGWTLVGARLWVPPIEDDPQMAAGRTAVCGYYVKTGGVINATDDTPSAIIEAVKANVQPSILLASGWNTVYFPEPIDIPLGAGIAIGWKIGNGDIYIASGRPGEPLQSFDSIPFWFASSSSEIGEKRGAFSYDDSQYSWSFQSNHYGGDIIIKDPPL